VTADFYSPLPPQRTGVADYSAALLSALRNHLPLRVNRDGDVNLYHLGNNQLHASIYRRALERPGVIVLHDAVLHHFMLGYFSQNEYVDEFVYNYGEWSAGLAATLWQNRAGSGADSLYFEYPMLKRIAERSLAVVVHNPAAAAIVRDHHPGARIFEIPHLFAPPPLPLPADVERFRAQCGPAPLFGVFGHLRESKRVLPILRLFAKRRDLRLLVAGDAASSDLRRAMEPFLQLPNMHRMGYMDSMTYWKAAMSLDVCINLRYPAAGETSGVSIGFMGSGKTVVMTDSPENSRYPDGICLRISSGLSEATELEAVAGWVASHRSLSREIGRSAAEYIQREHSLSRVAGMYNQALKHR